MRCLVGNFTWSLELDGWCPNHGSRDRLGRLRGPGDAMCDEDGPYDARPDGQVVPFLDCCSVPDPEPLIPDEVAEVWGPELDAEDTLVLPDFMTKGKP